jgi:hypothetical protein
MLVEEPSAGHDDIKKRAATQGPRIKSMEEVLTQQSTTTPMKNMDMNMMLPLGLAINSI